MRQYIRVGVYMAILIAPLSAVAQSRDDVINAITSANCRGNFACPDTNVVLPPAALAAAATQCISRSFGISRADPVFDASMGLDGDNCLRSSYTTSSKGMGGEAQVTPVCCVTVAPDQNGCVLTCAVLPAGQ